MSPRHHAARKQSIRRITTAALAYALVTAACGGVDGATGVTSVVTDSVTTAAEPEPNPESSETVVGPSTPPDIDMSRHSVPLDQVFFDTFDDGSVTLDASTPELRSRLLDAIPPIDAPVYDDAESGGWLEPGDLVLGYEAAGQAYAYPFKILNFHEIVNDELGGSPVLISYCPLCRSAVVYDRTVDDQVLAFGNTSALYESDMVMVDRTTGSYWWQVPGEAIVGPLTGARLQALPSEVASWSEWQERHPDTLVLSRDTGHTRPYLRDVFAGYPAAIDDGRFAFPVGDAARDGRLPASTLVVAVAIGETIRAYPAGDDTLSPINDVLGGEALVVVPGEGGAAVFSSVVDGRRYTFETRDSRLTDVETGSVWSDAGEALSGPLAGTELRALPSRTTFWFAMVGAFPEIEIFITADE